MHESEDDKQSENDNFTESSSKNKKNNIENEDSVTLYVCKVCYLKGCLH